MRRPRTRKDADPGRSNGSASQHHRTRREGSHSTGTRNGGARQRYAVGRTSVAQSRGNPLWGTPKSAYRTNRNRRTLISRDLVPSPQESRAQRRPTGEAMKTGIVIAALAAALITGSTVSSQAIPAAPLSKSIQQNSSSRRTRQISRVPRISRLSACRRLPRLPPCRAVPGLPGLPPCRPLSGLPGCRLLWIPRLPACRRYGYRGYRGYRWGGAALYRNRGCW